MLQMQRYGRETEMTPKKVGSLLGVQRLMAIYCSCGKSWKRTNLHIVMPYAHEAFMRDDSRFRREFIKEHAKHKLNAVRVKREGLLYD